MKHISCQDIWNEMAFVNEINSAKYSHLMQQCQSHDAYFISLCTGCKF